MTAGTPMRAARPSRTMTEEGAPNTRSPFSKTSGLYLNRKAKTDSIQLGIYIGITPKTCLPLSTRRPVEAGSLVDSLALIDETHRAPSKVRYRFITCEFLSSP